MLSYASSYVQDVWRWQALMTNKNEFTDQQVWREEYEKIDGNRKHSHDTYIDSISILSRNMYKRGIDNSWINELAPMGSIERVRCGKFAIMLMYDRYRNFKLSSGESYD